MNPIDNRRNKKKLEESLEIQLSNRRINKKKKKLKETIENSKKTIEGTRKNWSRVS